jgi:hypothetical protein
MESNEDMANRYRQHAVEVRATAEEMKDKAAKQTLLRVVDDYERMARQLETVSVLDRQLRARMSDWPTEEDVNESEHELPTVTSRMH